MSGTAQFARMLKETAPQPFNAGREIASACMSGFNHQFDRLEAEIAEWSARVDAAVARNGETL